MSIPTPTFRAILLISLAAYLLFFPARSSSDIIASGYAIACFSISFFIFWLLLINSRKLAKQTKVIFSIDTESAHYSKEAVTVLIKLSNFRLSGFVTAHGTLNFEQDGIKTIAHRMSASSSDNPVLSERLIFPHRGKWQLKNFSIDLHDPLGFFKVLKIEFPIEQTISILPEQHDSPEWNAISSALKEDDSIPHLTEKKGERYDFKPYHPSDGSRRIIWKMLAKSGELFSRHPEPAYSPEGKIGFFCMALKDDDKLAAQSISFMEKLENESIEVFFSTLSCKPNIAENPEQAADILMEHAWLSEEAADSSIIQAINNLLGALAANHSKPQNLCIAVSEESLKDEKYRSLILAADKFLLDLGITAHYMVSAGNSREPAGYSGNAFISNLQKPDSTIQWST